MKKIKFAVLGLTMLSMIACGEKDISVDAEQKEKPLKELFCDCFTMGQEMSEKMMAADGDDAKMEMIEEEFKTQKEECDKAESKFEDLVKDMSKDEKKALMEEYKDACPAFENL